MIISGLAKLTLLDFPGRTACTVFTGGCNFRCPFCHNAPLVIGDDVGGRLVEEDVLSHLRKRQGILDGVCITGGEPLLQRDIADFIKRIRELGYAVKLDTNGSFPEKLISLVEGGLIDYVAMDIKNSREKYGETVGLSGFDVTPICESVDFLKKGKIPYEFRTTVVREFHEKEDFHAIGEWLEGAKKYFLQAFSDKGELIQSGLHGVEKPEMQAFAALLKGRIETVELRGV